MGLPSSQHPGKTASAADKKEAALRLGRTIDTVTRVCRLAADMLTLWKPIAKQYMSSATERKCSNTTTKVVTHSW